MRNPRFFTFCFLSVLTSFGPKFAFGSTVTYSVSNVFTFSPTGGVSAPSTYQYGVSAIASPGGVPDTRNGSIAFPTTGGSSSQAADSIGTLSSASGKSSAMLTPVSTDGPVFGAINSGGNLNVLPGGACCSSSSAAIVVSGGTSMRAGNFAYTPQMSMGTPADCDCTATDIDPVSFQVTDLITHVVTSGDLYDVTSSLSGPGTFSWRDNTFSLNATNFDFGISLTSPFTVQHGTAVLQVRNGLITTSSGTGIFAGLFPTVGSSGNFAIPFGTNFSLDYNLGDLNGDPLAVLFTLGDSGSASVASDPAPPGGTPTDSVPEPTTWATGGLAFLLVGAARRRLA
jgi:hypothetical protein